MKIGQHFLSGLLLVSGAALADDLARDIDAWRPGMDIPHRLLSYPDGKVESHDGECYLDSNDARMASYIEGIKSDALLEELVFDHRSANSTFQHAVTTLIERKGLRWFASKLSTREITRWELDAFKQLLRSRHVRVSVATVEASLMKRHDALKALKKLKGRLENGQSWDAAYRAVADEYPDMERRKREPGTETTLITYLFDGWLAEGGFAFTELRVNPYLPQQHLKRIVTSGKGAQIIEGPDQIYVYLVSDVYDVGA